MKRPHPPPRKPMPKTAVVRIPPLTLRGERRGGIASRGRQDFDLGTLSIESREAPPEASSSSDPTRENKKQSLLDEQKLQVLDFNESLNPERLSCEGPGPSGTRSARSQRESARWASRSLPIQTRMAKSDFGRSLYVVQPVKVAPELARGLACASAGADCCEDDRSARDLHGDPTQLLFERCLSSARALRVAFMKSRLSFAMNSTSICLGHASMHS